MRWFDCVALFLVLILLFLPSLSYEEEQNNNYQKTSTIISIEEVTEDKLQMVVR
jgi:hypothetical protein